MAVPLPLLSLPFSLPCPEAPAAESEAPATDFRGSLCQVLEPWFGSRLPGQAAAAEMLWTTPRTLRRRLAEEGTSWRGVVKDLRFARAVARLEEGRFSVGEIAEELGYSATSHLTRFFRQRTGLAPSAYREEVERARELARRSAS
jgi:AraC-like DNA-binding protein